VSGEVAAAARAEIVARTGYGRLLAVLATGTHDIAGAEDALADAFERALRHWPVDGVPVRPEAWLLTVARNRLRDRWRSAEVSRTGPLDVERQAPVHLDDLDAVGTDALPERRLELMLVCAHPAVSRAAHTPLMLNTVLGFTAADIARAYAVPAATMTTRLTRAKRRIRDNRIPFEVPGADALRPRMDAVLAAVYAAYVIEWSTGPEERNLPPEGPYLAEVLAQLLPEDPEARGLAALVALSTARRPARTGPDGELVTLGDQDPSLWDAALIQRGHDHLRAAHAGGVLGRYQLEAAIQAVHCDRARTSTGPSRPSHPPWRAQRRWPRSRRRSTGRRRDSDGSMGSSPARPASNPHGRPGPISSPGPAGPSRPRRHTSGRSRSPTTPEREGTSSAGSPRCVIGDRHGARHPPGRSWTSPHPSSPPGSPSGRPAVHQPLPGGSPEAAQV
jgi:predicted RNA polymerase sigma factor